LLTIKNRAYRVHNLPVNALGIFDNPAFGTTTANFATQLVLESANPTIGKNPVIESVVLTIPYFSTLKSTDANGMQRTSWIQFMDHQMLKLC
jgi:hypothetical protein